MAALAQQCEFAVTATSITLAVGDKDPLSVVSAITG
jgi:hypothetical protein